MAPEYPKYRFSDVNEQPYPLPKKEQHMSDFAATLPQRQNDGNGNMVPNPTISEIQKMKAEVQVFSEHLKRLEVENRQLKEENVLKRSQIATLETALEDLEEEAQKEAAEEEEESEDVYQDVEDAKVLLRMALKALEG